MLCVHVFSNFKNIDGKASLKKHTSNPLLTLHCLAKEIIFQPPSMGKKSLDRRLYSVHELKSR